MMMTQQDWRKLRVPIMLLGLAMVTVGLLVSVADEYKHEHQLALQTQQNLFDEAKRKYESSGTEKELIMQYLPIYNELLSSGFVGEEHRIEWIETLRQTHAAHKLFNIDYQIGQQENYAPDFLPNRGNFILHRSVMKLEMDLLHEGDLLELLNGLQRQSTPYLIRECELSRPVGASINSREIVANLRAKCEIDWLTLRDPQLSGVLQ